MTILLYVLPSNALTITPPVGLGYISSVLLEHNYDVSILDSQKESLNIEKSLRKIKEMRPDVLGISILTSNYGNAKEIVKRVKQSNPSTKIVLGGPHPTALPEASLKETGADFLIRGEGEYTFLKLIEFLDKGQGDLSSIENLCYREDGQIRVKPNTFQIKDLDEIPFPAWDLMPPKEYPVNPHQFFFRKYPIAPIITSRGCPFACTFCATSFLFGKELRRRSPKKVVDEIELLVNKYNVKEIHFEDDNFTLLKEHTEDICQEIIGRKIKIAWQCPNGIRADTIDEDLIHLMKKSGCYRLSFGIESGSQEILDRTGKKLNLDNVSEVIRMVKDQDIQVQGFFILGLPGETEETIIKTLKLIKGLALDLVDIALLVDLPGSNLFNEKYSLEDYEKIKWDEFNYFTAQPTDNLPRQTLKRFQKLGLREFYLNPRTIKFLIRNIKIQQLPYIFRIVLKYII